MIGAELELELVKGALELEMELAKGTLELILEIEPDKELTLVRDEFDVALAIGLEEALIAELEEALVTEIEEELTKTLDDVDDELGGTAGCEAGTISEVDDLLVVASLVIVVGVLVADGGGLLSLVLPPPPPQACNIAVIKRNQTIRFIFLVNLKERTSILRNSRSELQKGRFYMLVNLSAISASISAASVFGVKNPAKPLKPQRGLQRFYIIL